MVDLAILFVTTVLQNASFTVASRARNSSSLSYNAFASLFSNGMWLVTMRQIVKNLDSLPIMIAYLVAATIGSVLMQWVSMRFIEHRIK